ncbi:hypothetical protein PM082_021842 [Marasmius tenuissimus]|nr:hypothetical protein PM082_021842 [Marasmius tenuissimus]
MIMSRVVRVITHDGDHDLRQSSDAVCGIGNSVSRGRLPFLTRTTTSEANAGTRGNEAQSFTAASWPKLNVPCWARILNTGTITVDWQPRKGSPRGTHSSRLRLHCFMVLYDLPSGRLQKTTSMPGQQAAGAEMRFTVSHILAGLGLFRIFPSLNHQRIYPIRGIGETALPDHSDQGVAKTFSPRVPGPSLASLTDPTPSYQDLETVVFSAAYFLDTNLIFPNPHKHLVTFSMGSSVCFSVEYVLSSSSEHGDLCIILHLESGHFFIPLYRENHLLAIVKSRRE